MRCRVCGKDVYDIPEKLLELMDKGILERKIICTKCVNKKLRKTKT